MRKPSPRRKTKEERLRAQLEKMDGDGIQLLINRLERKGGQRRTIKLCDEILMSKALRGLVKTTTTLPLKIAAGILTAGGKLALTGFKKLF